MKTFQTQFMEVIPLMIKMFFLKLLNTKLFHQHTTSHLSTLIQD